MTTPPSDHSLPALRARYGEQRYRWLLLLSVMVGTMAAIMSSTVINVAIPDMSHHFTLGQERAQWVTSGFMAAMTVSMLHGPDGFQRKEIAKLVRYLADDFGPDLVTLPNSLLIGLALFEVDVV